MSDGPSAVGSGIGIRPRRYANATGAAVGAVSGLLPHLLHHVGLVAGAAVLAGAAGTILFAIVGFAAMVPMLLRLRRRFATWWAPAVALMIFVVMFTVSTVLLGPALRADEGDPPTRGPAPTGSHTDHHR